jgi:copper homeostasis protein CutC
MSCGGFCSTNIKYLQEVTKATFYHSSAITDRTGKANEKQTLKTNLKQ